MLILLMLMIMFPGMITGSSTAAVLSSGSIVAPILLLMGIPAPQTGAILAIGAIMGMAAPPVNIPAMLIAGGVDMPYIGFEGPLFFMTIPGAIFTVLFIGLKHCKNLDYDKISKSLNFEIGKKYGFKLYLPIIVVIGLNTKLRHAFDLFNWISGGNIYWSEIQILEYNYRCNEDDNTSAGKTYGSRNVYSDYDFNRC